MHLQSAIPIQGPLPRQGRTSRGPDGLEPLSPSQGQVDVPGNGVSKNFQESDILFPEFRTSN